jgi:hypothetical protein
VAPFSLGRHKAALLHYQNRPAESLRQFFPDGYVKAHTTARKKIGGTRADAATVKEFSARTLGRIAAPPGPVGKTYNVISVQEHASAQ